MKISVFAFIALLSLFSNFQNEVKQPLVTFKDQVLEVNISHEQSEDTLMNLKKKLIEEHNVQLDFEKLIYNKKGKIESIRIAVKSPQGDSGTASSERVLGIAPTVWFIIDFNDKPQTSFGIGAGKRR